MSKANEAKELFEGGCNCCQAVFCAFADKIDIDKELAMRLSAGFGGGIGRMREVCGAVSGLTMVLSERFACTDPNNKEEKAALYALVQKAAGEFKEENGSIICRELLGLPETEASHIPEKRTNEYYKKRPCAELVHCAAAIAGKYLEESGQ